MARFGTGGGLLACSGNAKFSRMAKMPVVLALLMRRFSNICWMFTVDDGEASYRNGIVTCKFIKIFETVRPDDSFNCRCEDGASTSTQCSIR